MSWHGALHEVGFLLSFVGAIGACLVFARRYAALGRRGLGGGRLDRRGSACHRRLA